VRQRLVHPRRWLALGALGLAILLALGADDVAVQQRLAGANATLGSAQAAQVGQLGYLHQLGADLTLASTGDGAVFDLYAQTDATRFQYQGSLNQSQASIASQNSTIDWFNTCLGGARTALGALYAHDSVGAVQALGSVSGPCEELNAPGGPVYPFDFADPFVLRVGDTYFGYATNDTTGNVQVIESTDLSNWTTLTDALPALPRWARANSTWAPAVAAVGGGYLLYYTVSDALAGGTECISVATSASPQGPYTDSSSGPLVCQPNLGGSIDPSPYVAANGTPYLTWRSLGPTATLWGQQLNAAGTGLVGNPSVLLQPTQPWQGGIVEAPTMVVSGSQYLLFYSGNQWNSALYGVGVASCAGPLGPCADQPGAVIASQPAFLGPGGETVFTDAAGHYWIAFHGWLPNAIGYPNPRLLFIRPLVLTAVGAVIPSG
jgi:Glycosyl hydrolases family 43